MPIEENFENNSFEDNNRQSYFKTIIDNDKQSFFKTITDNGRQ